MSFPPGRHDPRDVSARGHLPLPEALFVLGHDETGRPRYHQRLLDMVIAGALLAEPTITGALKVADGGLDVAGEPRNVRDLQLAVLRTVANTPGRYAVDEWLARLAPDASARTGESLERAGLCRRFTARRLGLFREVRIRYADPSVLGRTEAWFTHALAWADDLGQEDAVLASLGREMGAPPPAYADLPVEHRRHRRTVIVAAMDDPVRRIVSATHAAITATAFGAYQ
ncbi:GOLPH3/VPS74 family protein [Actinocatenispora rupis]|uniref:Golgi phosphoprotein 3 (GPP34) n=1 Tax=Actinocatenispora rupis TaxID=519421 RepID=A0A8J3NBG2_9ACTN|nr:GPP34 family phosphoprotein [Actinocatenispora rupis]GID13324.1 hypothetical protein Aru02nite_42130 [Actinocatenispora rupis]